MNKRTFSIRGKVLGTLTTVFQHEEDELLQVIGLHVRDASAPTVGEARAVLGKMLDGRLTEGPAAEAAALLAAIREEGHPDRTPCLIEAGPGTDPR